MHPDLNTPETIVGGTLDWMGVAHMLAPARHAPGARAPAAAGARPTSCCSPPIADEMTEGSGARSPTMTSRRSRWPTVAADPARRRSPRARRLDHDHLLVHFDVDVVDFVDLPLSENTGLNIGLPFATARTCSMRCSPTRASATLTVTEHNPFHGAADGSTTAALADALAAALSE